MQREDVEQREQPVLVEQHEADQHQAAGQKMRDVEGDARPSQAPRDEEQQRAEQPSISAAPRKSGTRKTRILAIDVSNSASSDAADAELGEIGARRRSASAASRPGAGARPQGTKTQAISET